MENSMDMPQPDRLRFVGLVKSAEGIEAAKQYLETNKPAVPPELRKSPEREQQVISMVTAFSEFARNELGIDLSKRLPPKEKFHFFDEKGFHKIKKMYTLPPSSVGVYSPSGHIFTKEEPTIEDTLGNAQHEMIHVTSFRSINLCEIKGKLRIQRDRSGYTNMNNQALSMIDEALTEMTNLEVMADNWKNQPALNQMTIYRYKGIGYIEQIIVVDELIKRIADRNGREYKDVLRQLQKGKFLGEMQALRILTDEIGKDGMKMLAKWTLDPGGSIEIAQALGLTTAQTKLHALKQGQDVQVIEGIVPNIIVYKQGASEKVPGKILRLLKQVNQKFSAK